MTDENTLEESEKQWKQVGSTRPSSSFPAPCHHCYALTTITSITVIPLPSYCIVYHPLPPRPCQDNGALDSSVHANEWLCGWMNGWMHMLCNKNPCQTRADWRLDGMDPSSVKIFIKPTIQGDHSQTMKQFSNNTHASQQVHADTESVATILTTKDSSACRTRYHGPFTCVHQHAGK